MDQTINNTVDSMQNEIVSFLQKLIRIKSENPPGNYEEICRFLEEELNTLGFEVNVVEVPEELTKKEGLPTPRKNVIATMKGSGGGKSIIFNSHLDTVPAGDAEKWTYPPFSAEIANGRIYGRGATDSKGRLTSYVMAAVALKRSGIPILGDITIAATCDEETGGVFGAGYVTEKKLVSGDMAVIEGYSNHIVRAMAGVLQLRIVSEGIPAHSGFKWKGINAVEKMAKVIQGLSELQQQLEIEPSNIPGMRYTTVNIGVIKGGTKINVVPGSSEIQVDFRVIPEHSIDGIYNRVESIVERLQKDDPDMNIRVERVLDFQTTPTVTEESSPIIGELQEALKEVTGEALPVVGMLGQSDTRWFINSGIPGINFGPGTNDNNLHSYDEFMDIEDLVQTTKVLSVLVRNYCGNKRSDYKMLKGGMPK
ncbi:ArgE/DapE family deacylase [Fictibacillus sp. WQ 8-8]|uniref:M20 family metallopeptidase n=1 Tax=Fictibacillus sp. WQ 8-8 TaxID=2938788 RepID=UPI00210B382F|nr:ArgE/DapE family deacylase [Fictibacillus sp. WQ 8-8]MCQ6268355.1 ArgE/DapE family deacylase [Fictibacillus sp. WQ 8-8]